MKVLAEKMNIKLKNIEIVSRWSRLNNVRNKKTATVLNNGDQSSRRRPITRQLNLSVI